jgi:UDP-N-acetylmuramate--alanine ligase
MTDLSNIQRIHIIAIGGFGMSAIARILIQRGYQISGSDRSSNHFTRQLQRIGATIYYQHAAENIQDAQAVLISSAIPAHNPEVQEAQRRNIPIYKRMDMIDALMTEKDCLAIAGTHGKTTTTAMLAHILREVGANPSYIIGGVMVNTNDNAYHGTGQAFVIEADEYDNMFHGLHPQVAVVTSLEYDHPDFFKTPQDMYASFQKFVSNLNDNGMLIVCADNASSQLSNDTTQKVITYGMSEQALWQVRNIRYQGENMYFDVWHAGALVTMVVLQVYGEHNALNALAAMLVAHSQGITLAQAAQSLRFFKGTGRRFEVRYDKHEVAIVDDYAHHPTAIKTTIDAARKRYPNREVWAVWQPHTFSRTQELLHDYTQSFDQAHHVLITDIFASREAFTDSIHSQQVVQAFQHPQVQYSGTLENTTDMLKSATQRPSVILIMSAGDAPKIGQDLQAWLEGKA